MYTEHFYECFSRNLGENDLSLHTLGRRKVAGSCSLGVAVTLISESSTIKSLFLRKPKTVSGAYGRRVWMLAVYFCFSDRAILNIFLQRMVYKIWEKLCRDRPGFLKTLHGWGWLLSGTESGLKYVICITIDQQRV